MRIEKEKAPAGAGTPTEARNEDFEVNHSTSNSNTDGDKTLHISDPLHVGAENALTLRELVQLTGEDERSIRRRIQAERKAGKLILSDCLHGYFLPASEQEARRFIDPSLPVQLKSLLSAAQQKQRSRIWPVRRW